MQLEKQHHMLSCIISSRDLMALTSGIIKPSYFDPSLKKTVRFIQEYFEKYKDVPKLSAVRAECGVPLELIEGITKADSQYAATEIESFCREKAVEEAIFAGPALIDKGDFGKIIEQLKSAISVGLQKDLGLDYFANPEERLRNTLITQSRISTGLPELDEALGGGVNRQELLLFAANSGGGKSMTMLNIGINLLAQGLNGVYISLEMAEGIVSKRADSMITKIGQDSLLAEISKAASLIIKAGQKMGQFIIKRMPENRTNVNIVRSYLQQLEQSTGFVPDFIIIDYIDIMGTTMSISYDNLFVKDKYVTEEVRSLGFDFNAIVISASQLGRCISVESDIILSDGSTKKLKDIKVGDSLLSSSSGSVTVVATTPVMKKKTYRITLKNGQSIIATAEHRFPTDNGIKSIASGLSIGDSLYSTKM